MKDDKKQQRKSLGAIYIDASMAPVLKPNPKYCMDKFNGLTCYISYDDIMDLKFVVRARPRGQFNSFDSKAREIIVEYTCLKRLINDGWQLA